MNPNLIIFLITIVNSAVLSNFSLNNWFRLTIPIIVALLLLMINKLSEEKYCCSPCYASINEFESKFCSFYNNSLICNIFGTFETFKKKSEECRKIMLIILMLFSINCFGMALLLKESLILNYSFYVVWLYLAGIAFTMIGYTKPIVSLKLIYKNFIISLILGLIVLLITLLFNLSGLLINTILFAIPIGFLIKSISLTLSIHEYENKKKDKDLTRK